MGPGGWAEGGPSKDLGKQTKALVPGPLLHSHEENSGLQASAWPDQS